MSNEVRISDEENLQVLAEPTSTSPNTSQNQTLQELTIPALLFAIGGYLVFGLWTMEIPDTAKWPGPEFFPMIITISIFAVAAAMTLQITRGAVRSRRESMPRGPRTDWKSTATVVASFLAFALALEPLGWILSGAILFWGVARGLGSRRPLFDLGIALAVSSLIQLAFSAGLGLRLPSGIFGWF